MRGYFLIYTLFIYRYIHYLYIGIYINKHGCISRNTTAAYQDLNIKIKFDD